MPLQQLDQPWGSFARAAVGIDVYLYGKNQDLVDPQFTRLRASATSPR
jgi:hypothetical protein